MLNTERLRFEYRAGSGACHPVSIDVFLRRYRLDPTATLRPSHCCSPRALAWRSAPAGVCSSHLYHPRSQFDFFLLLADYSSAVAAGVSEPPFTCYAGRQRPSTPWAMSGPPAPPSLGPSQVRPVSTPLTKRHHVQHTCLDAVLNSSAAEVQAQMHCAGLSYETPASKPSADMLSGRDLKKSLGSCYPACQDICHLLFYVLLRET